MLKRLRGDYSFHKNLGKSGTGCISKISDNIYEGRYSPRLPSGKRVSKNVYAKTEEECEIKLAELIKTMKAEIIEN